VARRALVIGIDQYEHLPYPLEGCVNDAVVLSRLLETSFGFPRSAVVTLLDEQATRDRVLSELDALVEATEADDVVVVTYSGHGSQMTDREGDEPDGMDETIVPHDSGRDPFENRDITDDELYVRLLALTRATPSVSAIFDCCHSGSVLRDAFGDRVRWVPEDRRPVAELPPSTVTREAGGLGSGPSGWVPLGERYVLIAGCRDDESSFEHTVTEDGATVTQGALTYFLSREIARAGPGTTYRDVFEAASAQVTVAKPHQHPQLEGAGDRELFGVREIEPVRYVGVRPRMGRSVTLEAGLAHGVSVGSTWAVYPPGTSPVEGAERLGLVRVTTVRVTEADGDPVEEQQPDSIGAGCRAIEVEHDFGELRLRVQVVEAEGAAPLVELVDRSRLLRHTPLEEPADVRVYLVPVRDSASADDPVPQLGVVGEPTWAVVGTDGELVVPARPAGTPDAASVVASNLETLARYRQTLALTDPDAGGPLRGKVDLVLKRRSERGAWIDTEPDPSSGAVVYAEGDRVAVEVVNRSALPVYASILDFGVSGRIDLLSSPTGTAEPIAPRRSVGVGIREGDELELRFPAEALGSSGDGPAEGMETFKLIATTRPTDVRPLLQEGFRDLDDRSADGSAVEGLLARALTGRGARDVARLVISPSSDAWTTVARTFTLRRAGA
jgi:hypothetical protein